MGASRTTAGLSPRVRGNPDGSDNNAAIDGSIPARAGEPNLRCRRRWSTRVYPRACGGTEPALSSTLEYAGLSPRVRGNHIEASARELLLRSIPARAGEPYMAFLFLAMNAVYPRACGGTSVMIAPCNPSAGLSPRVRGNQEQRNRRGRSRGSIPARAGEPTMIASRSRTCRVYPRACGGTTTSHSRKPVFSGLSPRVRGNRGRSRIDVGRAGSIPARAGEPRAPIDARSRRRLYPRACGGTLTRASLIWLTPGLSPRVRGNQSLVITIPSGFGSIPARAGEPRWPSSTSSPRTVYPRACGGTAMP